MVDNMLAFMVERCKERKAKLERELAFECAQLARKEEGVLQQRCLIDGLRKDISTEARAIELGEAKLRDAQCL